MRADRRAALAALFLLCLGKAACAEGFAGLGDGAAGFEAVVPGKPLSFPKDFGAHPAFRIEWWYLTVNLTGEDGARYGAQWTLFRNAMEPNPERPGWADRTLYMAHAALTSATEHLVAEDFARGGVGQAGVTAEPFEAFIDDWSFAAQADGRYLATAKGAEFSYALGLRAEGPLVLHGDAGYSRKSEQGQASYYFSQPFFAVDGVVRLHGRAVKVTGRGWMDREWSSQPLSPDQKGWDWFALHLPRGERLMLYRFRGAKTSFAGTWIGADGATRSLSGADITLTPLETARLAERDVPIRWRVEVASLRLAIETAPLNPNSWMATRFPYWEGPISFQGSHAGEGYLEMTGY